MSQGTVLITGLGGFTGEHLAREMRAAGYRVEGTTTADAAGGPGLHPCDLTRPEQVRAVVARVRPDYVVHLAALSFVGHADQEAFYRVNLFGTLNLLGALQDEGVTPRKVLLASSAQVYGAAARAVLDESVCPRPVNHYAASKLSMEHMAATWFDRTPIVITRPFNYTGVGQSPNFLIPKIVGHFAQRLPRIELGNIDVEREFADVRQVCRTYRLLLESPVRGELFNVCCGTAHSLRSILDRMAQIAGYAIEVDVNPAFVRANEIPKLLGSNARLHAAIGAQTYPPIEETLRWMYEDGLRA